MFKRRAESYEKKEVHEGKGFFGSPTFFHKLFVETIYPWRYISRHVRYVYSFPTHNGIEKKNRHCQWMTCINLEKQLNIFVYVFL